MHIKITYDQLIKKLIQIGFIEKRMTGGHLIMSHIHYDALVVLPYFRKKEQVPIQIMTSIKKTITSKGILTPIEFDEIMLSKK